MIFTVRNEVVKVMFLQACVCPRGGVPDQVHPPRPGTPPLDQVPPRTRYTPQDQVHTPRTRYTPPRDTATAADGMHPTGRHSCIN